MLKNPNGVINHMICAPLQVPVRVKRTRSHAATHPQGMGQKTTGNEVVARDGIEPPTRGFSVRCSTN
jgi:hypothetical protein